MRTLTNHTSSSSSQNRDIRIFITEALAIFSSDPKGIQWITEFDDSISALIELLFSEMETLQSNIAIIIANLTANRGRELFHKQELIVRQGGLLALIPLLSSKSETLQKSVLLALGNLANENEHVQEEIIAAGGFLSIMKLIALAVSSSSSISASKKEDKETDPTSHLELLHSAMYTLNILSVDRKEIRQFLVDSPTLLEPIVANLFSSSEPIRQLAVSIVVNISCRRREMENEEKAERTSVDSTGTDPISETIWKSVITIAGIPALLSLIASHSIDAQYRASEELARMTGSNNSEPWKLQLKELNGISAVISLLLSLPIGNDSNHTELSWSLLASVRINCIRVLANISNDPLIWKQMHSVLPSLLSSLTIAAPFNENQRISKKDPLLAPSLVLLANLSADEDNQRIIMASGVLPRIIKLLSLLSSGTINSRKINKKDNESLLEYSLSLLLNCSSLFDAAETIYVAGGMTVLVPMLSYPSDSLRAKILLCIEHLIGRSERCRMALASQEIGGLESIIPMISSMNGSLQSSALSLLLLVSTNDKFCETLSVETCSGIDALIDLLQESVRTLQNNDQNAPCLPEFQHPQGYSKNETQTLPVQVLEIFVNLTSGVHRCREAVVNKRGLSPLLSLLQPPQTPFEAQVPPQVQSLALDVIANLSINAHCRNKIRESDALPLLLKMSLSSVDESLRISALKAISKVALDDTNRKVLGELGIIPSLISLLKCNFTADEIQAYQNTISMKQKMPSYRLPPEEKRILGLIEAIVCLKNISYDDRSLEKIKTCGGLLSSLLSILELCQQSPSITSQLLSTIKEFAFIEDEHRDGTFFHNHEGLKLIAKILLSTGDELTVIYGLELFHSLAYFEKTRSLICDLIEVSFLDALCNSTSSSYVKHLAMSLKNLLGY